MEPYPKTASLKDGIEVCLRPLLDNDLERSHAFFLNLPESDRQYLRYDVTDREILTLRMEHSDAEERWRIVAELGDKIIADALLIQPRHGWKRHTGEIRCIVAHDYQSRGLGWLMLNEIFQEATRRGVEKLWGAVTTELPHVRKMMERLGFTAELTLPNEQRSLHGELQDHHVMVASIASAWERMEDLIQGMDGVGREQHPRKKRSSS